MRLIMKLSIIASLALSLFSFSTAKVVEADYPRQYISVDTNQETKEKKLLIPIASYKNADGRIIDLVGVVHVGSYDYYEELNRRFQHYDRVFFEMIDGDNLVRSEILAKKLIDGEITDEEKEELDSLKKPISSMANPLSIILQIVTTYLISQTELDIQQNCIDYGNEHFIFADMTQKELSAAMKARGETMLGFALCEFLLGKNAEQQKASAALMERMKNPEAESTALVREFLIDGLAINMENDRMKDSAIIVSRNEKAMEVLDEHMKDESLKKVALFYGAAHIPDFHMRLQKRGYEVQSLEWLEAFSTDTDGDVETISLPELEAHLSDAKS